MSSPTGERLFIRLYTDEDVSERLVALLRERGYGALSTAEAGNLGTADAKQLSFATVRRYVLLTYNRDDFIPLAQRWYAEGREHAGIVLSRQFSRRETGELLRQVLNLLDRVTAGEMWNTVRNLQSFR